jgi:hypothetical protein
MLRAALAALLICLCGSAFAGDFITPGSRATPSIPSDLTVEHLRIEGWGVQSLFELDDDGESLDIRGPEGDDEYGTIKMRTNWLRVLGNTITVEGDWAADPDDASYFSARVDGFADSVPMPNGTVLGGFNFQATDVAGSGNPIDYVQLDAVATAANSTGELYVKLGTAGFWQYEYILSGASLRPYSNDGAALGDADQMWSDLFLASGAVQNWNNGDCLLTHSADTLTLTGCAFAGTSIIDSTAITNSTIVEADINAIDVPNDEECLTYEASNFEWQACGSQTPWTSDIDAGGFDLAFDDNTGIFDDDGDELLIFQDNGGTDVNWLEIQNAASGANPSFIAAGSDGNIGFNFYAKGNAGYSLTVPRFMMDLGAGGGANLVIKNSSDTAFGPGIAVYHDTVSPAAGDTTFFFTGQGEDSGGNAGDVAGFDIKWIDPTATLEDGEFIIKAIVAGTHDARLKVGDGVIIGTGTTYPGVGNLSFPSGGVINWDASDVLITHSANDLAFTGVTGDYSFDDTVGVTGSVTASVNVTATAGDVTSGDDVIPGDDILMGTVGGIDWGGGIMNLTYQGTDLVSFQGGSFGVHQATDTISSDAVGFSRNYIVVDTQGAAATDDLSTMTAPPSNFGGVPKWVQAANDARTVVIKGDSTGNIVGPGGADCILDDAEDMAELIFNSTMLEWVITSCSQVNREHITVAASDETTAITAATGKVKFRMPYAFNVDSVSCSLSTAQNTTGAGTIFTVDINEGDADLDGGNPVSILSTKVTIDDDETTSVTATTAPVLSDVALASNAEMTIDVDAIGDSADAAGLKCSLIGHQ